VHLDMFCWFAMLCSVELIHEYIMFKGNMLSHSPGQSDWEQFTGNVFVHCSPQSALVMSVCSLLWTHLVICLCNLHHLYHIHFDTEDGIRVCL